jgi:hypothetical protein
MVGRNLVFVPSLEAGGIRCPGQRGSSGKNPSVEVEVTMLIPVFLSSFVPPGAESLAYFAVWPLFCRSYGAFLFRSYPQLALWAAFFRRFAAEAAVTAFSEVVALAVLFSPIR